jgi:hypothetical protein
MTVKEKKKATGATPGNKSSKKSAATRAAKLAPHRRESTRKAVQARLVKEGSDYIIVKKTKMEHTPSKTDTSDRAMLTLLKRIKATNDPKVIRQLSDQLQRVIFHKQYANA